MKTLDERAQVAFEAYCQKIPERLAEFGDGPHPALEGVHLDYWRGVVRALDADALKTRGIDRELKWENPQAGVYTAKGIIHDYTVAVSQDDSEDDPLGFTWGDWINYAGNASLAKAACQAHHDSLLGTKRASWVALADIAHQIRTQDNRITAHPIFVVEQKRRIYGMDPEFATEDKIAWLFDGEVETDPDEIKRLEKEYEDTGKEPMNHTRTGYSDVWEFVTACFTQKGCEDYLAADGHNLKETRIYVHSGHRNQEFQRVREVLSKIQEK